MRPAPLAWVFLGIVWGSTWPCVKIGLVDLPPLTFAGLRFAIAALVLQFAISVRGVRMPRKRGEWLLVLGTAPVTISFHFALQFWAQQHVASGLASLLSSMLPVFVVFFAHWWVPSESLNFRKLLGVAVGLLGVAVISSNQLHSQGELAFWGSVALVVGAAGAAQAQVLVKKYGGGIDPMVIAGWQMTVGCVPLLGFGFLLEQSPLDLRWTTSAVGALLYLSIVGSALAFFLMYWLYRHMEITKVLSVAFLNPLVATLLGVLILGEELNQRIILGGLVILCGLALVLRAENTKIDVTQVAR